jgi:cation:H+ antiporter
VAVSLVLLVGLAIAVVGLTRLIVRGIEMYAAAGGMSAKSKGQFLGYATSLPEMVGTVGTAGNGLLGAGLWNIGASNVINVVLFTGAAMYYGRIKALKKRKFLDEMGFAFAAFCVPVVLSTSVTAARSPYTAAALFAFFVSYIYIDKKLNPNPPLSVAAASARGGEKEGMAKAFGYIGFGVLGIVLAGNYLGEEAKVVVDGMGVPEWAVGWILGFITSLPEMTAFFAVFSSAKDAIDVDDDTDCQENLDSLAASNMSNLGLIYPMGVAVFLLFGQK